MNRNDFKEILESVKIPEGASAEDLQRLVLPINKALLQMVPERLFKYRSCCDKHVSAFENDELWMSTSDLFNDPFDTLIQYDVEELRRACDTIVKPDIFSAITRFFAEGGQMSSEIDKVLDDAEMMRLRELAKQAVTDGVIRTPTAIQATDLKLTLEIFMSMLPKVVQRFSMVTSLSERIDSILMWSHYSHNHTGFALEYDPMPFLLPNDNVLGLFPVVYSNKRYDANEFLMWIYCMMFKIPAHNPDTMNSIKLLLYKAQDWDYEQEWRLINSKPGDYFNGRAEAVNVKPRAIYYGCKISDKDRNRLHEIAVRKGICEYSMEVDYASNEYRIIVRD